MANENQNNNRINNLEKAFSNLNKQLVEKERLLPFSFDDFLKLSMENPYLIFRDIFQVFYDMVHYYVQGKETQNKNAISDGKYIDYDFTKLLIDDCDNPFFADKLFADRFMNLVNGFKDGTRKNQIVLFDGPPGSGKSTFLNNLLQKLEEYTHSKEGAMFTTYWKLDIEKLGGYSLTKDLLEAIKKDDQSSEDSNLISTQDKYLEFLCPNHDHPILHIPKKYRKAFLKDLIDDRSIKRTLFNDKQYEWIFTEAPCSICKSLYNKLLDKLGSPTEVYKMLFVRGARFNRQFGEGISLFNPGDRIYNKPITNPSLEEKINNLIKSEQINYTYSILAKTNNGVFALMDIKEENIKRLIQLHGIISDGIHKVGLIEESIKSLFVGLVNPGDKVHYEDIPSFKDRIIEVNIPYVLDYNTEVSIYKDQFGNNIRNQFLPGVLKNFAKIMVSTRLNTESETIKKWISKPDEYSKYLDKNNLLLKMEVYTGELPSWLNEDDLKAFTPKLKRKLLREAEQEGNKGFTGRQSINLFRTFLIQHEKPNYLITMADVGDYFLKEKSLKDKVSAEFVHSIKDLYDYIILQEVKECIYSYNKDQMKQDIVDYLFAVNFELGAKETNPYSGKEIKIDDELFSILENVLFPNEKNKQEEFRKETQIEYVSQTLAQEIKVENKPIDESTQFKTILEKYTRKLKENALTPFLENENFRRAIIDYDTPQFDKYDTRLKNSVNHLIKNLVTKYSYSIEGAIQITLYIIDGRINS